MHKYLDHAALRELSCCLASVQRQNHAIEHGAPHEVAYRLTFVRGQSHAVVQRKNRIFSVDSNGACAVFPLHNESNYVY